MGEPDVIISEVMLRDGIQNLRDFIPTEVKIELFKLILESGIRDIEITSFVNPKAIPQFKDAADVARAVLSMTPDGVAISSLIPNLKGAQNALNAGIRKLDFVMSVSESHNLSNVRRTPAESIEEMKRILELKPQFPDMNVKAGMACVFGCPFEGKMKPEVTLNYIRRFYELGIRDMSVADTVGFGNPKEVKEVTGLCKSEFPDVTFGVHLHNTRGLGLANALVAYENGIRIIDGAVGGLGGCPFAPGASGNTSTEDLVFMFEDMGINTGINIDKLIEVSRYFKDTKKDVCFNSGILQAGVPAPRGVFKKEASEQSWNISK